MPRTATSPARRNSGREDHPSASKPALKPIPVPPRCPRGAAHPNGNLPRIQLSDEPLIQRAITLVQGKWRIAILYQLQDGPVRVGELKRRMAPISKKVLNQHLRRMVNDGLLVRTEQGTRIPQVEYALATPFGYSVLLLLQAITQWGSHARPSPIPSIEGA